MSPLVDLVIRTPFEGAEERFAEAMAAREQHWSGPSGLGGDVQQRSRLDEVLEAHLNLEAYHEADLRYAARKIRAAFPDNSDMSTLAAHIESWEVYAAEQAERELTRQMGMTESMMEFLREAGVPVRPGTVLDSREDQGRAWPRNNAGRVHEPLGLPRTGGYAPYPTATEPEPIDEDRRARGATEPAMSDRLRGLAREIQMMAGLSADVRTKNRLMRRAGEIQRLALRQYSKEMEGDLATSDDPDEAGNALNRLARDMRTEARAAGAQDGDFASFDDWDDGPRQGSDDEAIDDVDGQKRAAADDMMIDEDLPKIPAPGRRYAEDQLGDPAAGTDEPAGARRNKFDDFRGHVRRGPIPSGSGKPRIGDRFGGERGRYSAFNGRESLREADLTGELLEDQRLHWLGSHGSW